jgi:hypothetical protein
MTTGFLICTCHWFLRLKVIRFSGSDFVSPASLDVNILALFITAIISKSSAKLMQLLMDGCDEQVQVRVHFGWQQTSCPSRGGAQQSYHYLL